MVKQRNPDSFDVCSIHTFLANYYSLISKTLEYNSKDNDAISFNSFNIIYTIYMI